MSYKNLHNCRSDDKSYGCLLFIFALYILIFYDFRILVKFVFMFVCRPMYVCMFFLIICIFCMCCSRGLIDDNDNNNRHLRACDREL